MQRVCGSETFFDTTCNRNITGNVVVVARDNATPTIISDTLGINKQITFHKAHRPIYRIAVGNKGRAGVFAVQSFLHNVRNRVPQAWKVQRQRTPITMQREMSLSILNSRIQQVISTEPSWTGMTSHVATNGSAIFLSYADRKCTLDPKNSDAVAYRYPVWLHFPFDGSMRNGAGGLNYKMPIHMHDKAIKDLINSAVPFGTAHGLNDNNNNNNNNKSNNDNHIPLVANLTPEHVYLGLMSIFLSLITLRSNQYGITKGSQRCTHSASQDHMEDQCSSLYSDDDSWTSMSD